MKELTKAEEQLMQILWDLKKGFLKDIVEKYPEPRPAYTTVSTVIRVLIKKGFIEFRTYGKTNEYTPAVSKTEYFKSLVKPMLANYVRDSPTRLASFFADESLTLPELEEVKALVEQRIKKLKQKK